MRRTPLDTMPEAARFIHNPAETIRVTRRRPNP